LDIRALRLRHEQSVKEIGSGPQRVHALRVVEEIPGHRLAYSHADGKQREAKKADEAQSRDGFPQIAHEITN
jgi:hypothetical protein